jgi:tRNA(Arg) A34 adenosine deaminase TadA
MGSNQTAHSPEHLLSRTLSTVENSIIPLTRKGVSSGSKIFGAAILACSDLQPLSVATNHDRVSPLLHGEINCIQQFFTVDFPDPATRPNPRTDCIFFATHEPCSLCISGIAWSGFSEVYYMFTYEDSRDLFSIPYDIEVTEQVFRVQGEETEEQMSRRPLYNRENKFFKAKSLKEVVDSIDDVSERSKWASEVKRIKELYNSLSATYQEGKKAGVVTSSAWK